MAYDHGDSAYVIKRYVTSAFEFGVDVWYEVWNLCVPKAHHSRREGVGAVRVDIWSVA